MKTLAERLTKADAVCTSVVTLRRALKREVKDAALAYREENERLKSENALLNESFTGLYLHGEVLETVKWMVIDCKGSQHFGLPPELDKKVREVIETLGITEQELRDGE